MQPELDPAIVSALVRRSGLTESKVRTAMAASDAYFSKAGTMPRPRLVEVEGDLLPTRVRWCKAWAYELVRSGLSAQEMLAYVRVALEREHEREPTEAPVPSELVLYFEVFAPDLEEEARAEAEGVADA